jgi:hypothetical protein
MSMPLLSLEAILLRISGRCVVEKYQSKVSLSRLFSKSDKSSVLFENIQFSADEVFYCAKKPRSILFVCRLLIKSAIRKILPSSVLYSKIAALWKSGITKEK